VEVVARLRGEDERERKRQRPDDEHWSGSPDGETGKLPHAGSVSRIIQIPLYKPPAARRAGLRVPEPDLQAFLTPGDSLVDLAARSDLIADIAKEVTRHHQSDHHASPCHFSHLALPQTPAMAG
jgi:hypothetical protein